MMDDNREHVVSLICSDLTDNNANKTTISTKLSIIKELTLFSSKKNSCLLTLTGQINSALSSSNKRLQGLCLLQSLVPQCDTELFLENALTWARLLLQALQSYDPAVTKQLACHVTCLVLRHASRFPQLNREFASTLVPQLISSLLDAGTQWQLAAVQCVSCCLQAFHGPCGPFKRKIEILLLDLLAKYPSENVEVLAECYALLAQAGGGGNLGIKHTESWTAQCDKLLVSMHHVLTQLLQGIESDEYELPVTDVEDMFPPASVPEVEPQRTFTLQSQFAALCGCMKKLLSLEFPAAVHVPVADMLDLMWRVLSVTDKRLLQRGPTQERVLLSTVLPSLHKDVFDLLETLIVGCHASLAIHNSFINRLFMQTLNWTAVKSSEYGQERPYSCLRSTVYGTLERWLKVAGASAGMETMASELLQHLLADAKPSVDAMKLDAKKKKKADQPENISRKKKGGSGDIGQLSTQRKIHATANSTVCSAALTVLRLLPMRLGSLMKQKNHHSIQEFVVHTLLAVQQSESTPMPYSCPSCRHALYRVLHACMLVPHPEWPAPSQVAVVIFRNGLQDHDLEVSHFCSEALLLCDTIIHPRAPPLYAPLPASVVTLATNKEDDGLLPVHHQSHLFTSEPEAADQKQNHGSRNEIVFSTVASQSNSTNSHKTSPVAKPGTSRHLEISTHMSSPEESSDDESEDENLGEADANPERTMETSSNQIPKPAQEKSVKMLDISQSLEDKNPAGQTSVPSQESIHQPASHLEEDNLSAALVNSCSSSSDVPTVSAPSTLGAEGGSGKPNGQSVDKESHIVSEHKETIKRKIPPEEASEEPLTKKAELDETDLMLESFIDAGPDSD